MKKKVFLFVDGTNLYASQYKLFGPDKFLLFPKFIEEVEKKVGQRFDKIFFYASYSPRSKKPSRIEKKYLKNEALFYRSVKATQKLNFFKGYRSTASGKEKEVDVKLTADLVSLAFLDEFNIGYILTGDADFLQAIFTIQRYHNKKSIYLICMENKIMHKGAYYFKTFIISFSKNKIIFHKKQKIEILNINSRSVVEGSK